jgi:hypothetical protein
MELDLMTVPIELDWTKYANFFDLWRNHRRSRKLLYVIGDRHDCYVGSIGSFGGLQGLGTRYQWQYVSRARAIFGLGESHGQVAYAGVFRNPDAMSEQLILATEADAQSRCILVLGTEAVLFEPEDIMDGITVHHFGDYPPFLVEPSR